MHPALYNIDKATDNGHWDNRLLQLAQGQQAHLSLFDQYVKKWRRYPKRCHNYVSLQMALAHYHLIPEHVALVTSVTTQRPGKYENKFGRFSYRHINTSLFFGIEYRLLVNDEYAYVAMPEKALLDLVHFRPRGDSREYFEPCRFASRHKV